MIIRHILSYLFRMAGLWNHRRVGLVVAGMMVWGGGCSQDERTMETAAQSEPRMAIGERVEPAPSRSRWQPRESKPAPTPSMSASQHDQKPDQANEPSEPTPPTPMPAEDNASEAPPSRSSYSAQPPYKVVLDIDRPTENQPGWLRILEFQDADQSAATIGKFPKKNRIYVETDNVRQLRIHVGHLPLNPSKRVILYLDGQPIELSKKYHQWVTLERRRTGLWATSD